MKYKIHTIFLLLTLLLCLFISGCKARSPILDWIIDSVHIQDGNSYYVPYYYFRKMGVTDLHTLDSVLTTENITIKFEDNRVEFVDYYGQKHNGTYTRNQKLIIKMNFNETVINARRDIHNWSYKSDRLEFKMDNIQYIFYGKGKVYTDYTTSNLEADLKEIGETYRAFYEDPKFQYKEGRYIVDNVLKASIELKDNKITLYSYYDHNYEMNEIQIFMVDQDNMLHETTEFITDTCIYLPQTHPVVIFTFIE